MAIDATPAPDGAAPESQGVSRTGQLLIAAAAMGGAISNFLILFIAARTLSTVQNTEFLVFWSLLFGLFGVQSGIQNETVRATTAPVRTGGRMILVSLAWGVLFALALAGSSAAWGPRLVPLSGFGAVSVLVAIAVLYPLYITTVGALGGARRWEWYGAALLIEVGLRVVLVLVAALAGAGILSFELASAAAVLTLAVILVAGRAPRRAIAARGDAPAGHLARTSALAMTSTACTALLVTGYPVLVRLTNPVDSLGLPLVQADALTGACILAVSLTRAPIMMPLTAFQGVAISAFSEHRGSVWAAVRRPFLLLGAVGLVGAALAWPIGPWALRLFNPAYDLPGWYLAVLTAASVLMAYLTILGALALATRHHGLYLAGWLVASAVAVVCLLLPLSLLQVTALSVAAGPALGSAVILLRLSRR